MRKDTTPKERQILMRITLFLRQNIRRQQRLFTGSLFPEEVNDKLHDFTQRHGLRSNVWVPRKAFDIVFKSYEIYVLPSAALCDTTIMFRTSYTDMIQSLGRDPVLINADYTSNPTFVENFHENIVPHPEPEEGTASDLLYGAVIPHFWPRRGAKRGPNPIEEPTNHGLKGPHEVNSCGSSHVANLQHPLMITGPPILNGSVVHRLLKIQSEKGYRMNYWFGSTSNFKTKSYRNVEELPYPGRYNPTWCVLYKPHTRTNQSFPRPIRLLMLQRAVEYHYVSRLWVTLREAEELYRKALRPERAHDAPPIFCSAFSGGIDSVQFYCADQFADGEAVFCNYRETGLCASGVRMPPSKLRGFPLLDQLMGQGVRAGGPDMDAAKLPSVAATSSGERSGADIAKLDSEKHIQFMKAVAVYENIRLFKFSSKQAEQKYLLQGDFRANLRKQCILCGFPTPHFINTKTLSDYALYPASQEVGFICNNPIFLWDNSTWLQQVSWFNVSQLVEPLVALTLIYRHPTHFLTGNYLHARIATQCARLQVLHQYKSHDWIPYHIVCKLDWSVQRGAPGITYMSKSEISNSSCYECKLLSTILFNLDEIPICQETKDWVGNYLPVDSKGRLFVHSLRILLKLRAYERGYHSAVWVVIKPFRGYRLKKTIPPVVDGARPSMRSSAFLEPLTVQYGEYFLANEEETESCSPGESSSPEGVSPQYNDEDDFLIIKNDEYRLDTFSQHRESLLGGDEPSDNNRD